MFLQKEIKLIYNDQENNAIIYGDKAKYDNIVTWNRYEMWHIVLICDSLFRNSDTKYNGLNTRWIEKGSIFTNRIRFGNN